jgi:hypothetical protein
MTQAFTRAGVVTLVVADAVALAGCTSSGHTGHGAGPTSAGTPAPSVTPALPTGKPALSQLVVSPDGLGYLVPGAAVPTKPAATAIMNYNPTKCVAPAEGVTVGSPGAGAWVPAYPNGLTWSGSGAPFDVGPVGASTDAIAQIEIWSPNLKTAKGIGAGSTVAQRKSAYGASLTLDSAPNGDVYILRGTHSKLLFEVAKAPAGLPVEETATVVWMRIVPLAATTLHIADTDATGPCAF